MSHFALKVGGRQAIISFTMGYVPDPKLDYKPTTRLVFRHGNLLDELRDIRKHHASGFNQVIHVISMIIAFIFVESSLVLIGKIFTVSIPVLIELVVAVLVVPFLGFYWYLDPLIAIVWMPIFLGAIVPAIFIAEELAELVPRYGAIPTCFVLALVSLIPQLIGHLLLERIRSPAFETFEFAVLTPFFLGYCMLGWLSCWHLRKDATDKIWDSEVEEFPQVTDPDS